MTQEHAVITFRNVGAKHLTWTATLPIPLTWRSLMREIRKHKALMSKGVEFDENGGIYVGGMRHVGEWAVEDPVSLAAGRER